MSDERRDIPPSEDAGDAGITPGDNSGDGGVPPGADAGDAPAIPGEHTGDAGATPGEHGTEPRDEGEDSRTPYQEQRDEAIERHEQLAPSEEKPPPPLTESGEQQSPGPPGRQS